MQQDLICFVKSKFELNSIKILIKYKWVDVLEQNTIYNIKDYV